MLGGVLIWDGIALEFSGGKDAKIYFLNIYMHPGWFVGGCDVSYRD